MSPRKAVKEISVGSRRPLPLGKGILKVDVALPGNFCDILSRNCTEFVYIPASLWCDVISLGIVSN